MTIDGVGIYVEHKGGVSRLLAVGKPFGVAAHLTLPELDGLILELQGEASRWRRSLLPDYYRILGVEKDASSEAIKKAFRSQQQKHHPDKGGNELVSKQINEAYEILSDSDRRSAYDATLNP